MHIPSSSRTGALFSEFEVTPAASISGNQVKAYIRELSDAKEYKSRKVIETSIWRHRLSNRLEKYLPEIVATENARKPNLNLRCFESAEKFGAHIHGCYSTMKRGIERAIILTQVKWDDKDVFHSIACETRFDVNGIFIRAYDTLGERRGRISFDCLRDALDISDIPDVKLRYYALDVQTATVGCQIFALNFALRSYKWAESNYTLDDFNSPDQYELKVDNAAVFIPPEFFKHAQSKTRLKSVVNNHKGWTDKNGLTLLDHYRNHKQNQTVMETQDLKVLEMKYSRSIDNKRLVLLQRLIDAEVVYDKDDLSLGRSR